MNLSNKQIEDLRTIEFFCNTIDKELRDNAETWNSVHGTTGVTYSKDGEDPVRMFFDYSDKGIQYRGRETTDVRKFNLILEGKRRRGIYMGMWEEGILDGSVCFYTLLGGETGQLLPRCVVDFMKKEMFKGCRRDAIEETYERLLTNN